MGHIYRFLDTNGDGTGSKNANVNGSITPQVFRYDSETTHRTYLARMLVHIEDIGPLSADDYGGITGPLTNGVLVEIRRKEDDSTVVDLVDGLPIKTNSEWSRMCYDMDIDNFGSGSDFIKVRWTFAKSGLPIYLSPNQYFCIIVQDNLTGLIKHYFMLQGTYTQRNQ